MGMNTRVASGTVTIEEHKQLVELARETGKSINAFVTELIRARLVATPTQTDETLLADNARLTSENERFGRFVELEIEWRKKAVREAAKYAIQLPPFPSIEE